jgi:quinol monooxygenase YgiN
MYPLISTWTVLPDKKELAIEALQTLALRVEKEEPNTLMYTVHTPYFTYLNVPTPADGEIIFSEIYKDESAFHAHVSGDIFVNFLKDYASLFLCNEGKPVVTLKIMSREAGFIRHNL